MRFIFALLLAFGFSVAARAQEPVDPAPTTTEQPTPPAVAALLKPESQATYLGDQHGYQTWVLAGPEQNQVAYLRDGEGVAISGTMTNDAGENLSAQQLQAAIDSGALQNIQVNPAAKGAGNQFISEVSALRTLNMGPADGKAIYVFMDPNCPYCKEMDQTIMAQITAGKPVQLMAIPTPILGKDSHDKALRIYSAPSPSEAWKNYIETGALPDAPTDTNVRAAAEKDIQANLDMMKRWKLGLVPMLTWRGANGRVMINYGTPKDVREFWHSVGIE